jgi:hypothetical protein
MALSLRGLLFGVLITAGCGVPAPTETISLEPTTSAAAADPLPSWNAGAARNAILDFVARVTREGGPDFVPPTERIATFETMDAVGRKACSVSALVRTRSGQSAGRTAPRVEDFGADGISACE